MRTTFDVIFFFMLLLNLWWSGHQKNRIDYLEWQLANIEADAEESSYTVVKQDWYNGLDRR